MSYQDAKFWFDVIQTLLIAAIGVMNWLNNRQRVTTETINRLERDTKADIARVESNQDKRMDGVSDRLTRMEADLENMPSHNDLGKIYDEIRKQSEAMASINANVASQASTLKSLNDWIGRVDSFLRSAK